jgi:hypothetical protein
MNLLSALAPISVSVDPVESIRGESCSLRL